MPKNYVGTLTAEQAAALSELLTDRGWEIGAAPYARFRARNADTNVVAYESGKLVVQGKGTDDFIAFILEPEITGLAPQEPPETFAPHGGIDESGKGDFFGPLAVAGVCVDETIGPELRKLGVRDSKQIGSDTKIAQMARGIRTIAGPDRWTVLTLRPETYNRLYGQIGNLNRLLAWGHARIIENLLEKSPGCPRMLSDRFGDESLIRRALMERGKKIQLDQRTRAESDVAVAAASILARDAFVRGVAALEKELGVALPHGAGPAVRKTGDALYAAHGAEVFARCAKIHFKTFGEITGKDKKRDLSEM